MKCYSRGDTPKAHKVERIALDGDSYVMVRELTSTDFLDLEKKYPPDSKQTVYDVVCDMLARCLVDDEGRLLFRDGEDLQANFPVGMSTIWKLRDKVDDLSAPVKDKEKN